MYWFVVGGSASYTSISFPGSRETRSNKFLSPHRRPRLNLVSTTGELLA